MLGSDNKSTALILIRVALAATMFIHGGSRISFGTVGGFGEYLSGEGFPLGFYLAWAITLFEIVGSVLLAVGVYAWVVALIFAAQLIAGVAMVHWKEGWFVVGHGRNGMEFSALLIVCFLATALANYKRIGR
ncbi:MAG TPA: DoxX family protein [Pyrinomonadaceae bacterium]|nr:DoxX family protein [Pyrinomonadaceae bacterium]